MGKLLDLDGFLAIAPELKRYIDNLVETSVAECVVQEDSFLKFPATGNENSVYIDTSTNKSYRWDDATLKYYVTGSDYNDIEIINGCL